VRAAGNLPMRTVGLPILAHLLPPHAAHLEVTVLPDALARSPPDHPFPVMIDDLYRLHRRQLSRLRDLSVQVHELPAEEAHEALLRFTRQFIGVERAEAFLAEVGAARSRHREVEYGQWLWEGSPLPDLKPRFGWLSDWMPAATCIRFDRRVTFPALRLGVPGMLDEWAFSWPGAYVSFDTSRALLVSLDYEVTCYHLLTVGKPPYR